MMRGERVLIADDDEDMRAWLRSHLQSFGATVDETIDGPDLLEWLVDRGPYALVVTDEHMPILNGQHAIAMARTAFIDTPFLVISADTSGAFATEPFTSVSFVAKPLNRAQLLAAVSKLLPREEECIP